MQGGIPTGEGLDSRGLRPAPTPLRLPISAPVPTSHMRLPRKTQGSNAATLQGIPSALAEIQGNPLQPEPPRMAAARTTRNGAAGVRGDAPFSRPPGGFAPLSTRESGLPATKGTTNKTQTEVPHMPLSPLQAVRACPQTEGVRPNLRGQSRKPRILPQSADKRLPAPSRRELLRLLQHGRATHGRPNGACAASPQ